MQKLPTVQHKVFLNQELLDKKRINQKIIASIISWLTLLIFSCSSHKPVDQSAYQKTAQTTAIVDVSILSVGGNTMTPQMTVILNEGKITRIGKNEPIPMTAKIIDGKGKFLIPGLIDSHVHISTPNDFLLYLAKGVTYIREMSGNEKHLAWQKAIENGGVGPRLYIASEKIGSKSGLSGLISDWFYTRINVSTPAQADKLIDRLISEGYQSAKISSDINKDMYLAVTNAAKQHQFPVVGHIPNSIKLDQLWQSGQQEIAHIEELTKALNNEFGGYTSKTAQQFLQFVQRRCNEVASNLNQHEIAVATSLWYMDSLPKQALSLENFIQNIRIEYANPQWSEDWLPGANQFEVSKKDQQNAEVFRQKKVNWGTYISAIRIMTKALINNKVTLLAGTDANTSLVVPGFSLHDELIALVDAGMTPAEALRSATQVPGHSLGVKTGIIKTGYDADLILLTDNPLLNISHTSKIDKVIVTGKIFEKSELDKMLLEIKTLNGYP